MAKCRDFDRVVRAFKSRYGIDLSHMRMKWSKHPVYVDGRRSFEFPDNEHGGSWCSDGAIRINPNMRPVMERFGIGGKVSEFRRRLIAHELAHEVWHNQSDRESIKKLIRDSLRQARKEKFTTPYLDTYSQDTPKKKFDSELFAEWMSDQLNKQGSAEVSNVGSYNGKNVYRLDYDFSKANGMKRELRKYMAKETLKMLLADPAGSGGGFAERASDGSYAIHIDNSGAYNKTDAEKKFVELHELGHIMNGHADEKYARSRGPRKEKRESEANRYALDSAPEDMKDAIRSIISAKFSKKAQAYEPPWTINQIRENLGDEVADRLVKDPVHKWRSDTGIELVHKEPTKEELLRIIENWRLMDALKKRRSNRKSKELFGMTNLQHAKELLEQ